MQGDIRVTHHSSSRGREPSKSSGEPSMMASAVSQLHAAVRQNSVNKEIWGILMPIYPTPTQNEASRFLSHAALGHTQADIESVQQLGYEEWLRRQLAAWRQTDHWNWLLKHRNPTTTPKEYQYGNGEAASAIRRFIEGRDLLRQKMVFALSEIVVVSLQSEMALWQSFGGANHLDILERNAFGNYRTILGEVSRSLLMGLFLTFNGSAKAGINGGINRPDENYARELLQLFTIGLNKLGPDGVPLTPLQPTYSQDDVTALARVFTGRQDFSAQSDIDRWKRPINKIPAAFDDGEKQFDVLDLSHTLPGNIIPARGENVALSDCMEQHMDMALDAIFHHPNVGPFISRQLIQRLVTSNPSPTYVSRVAAVFNDNGQGVKGDLAAVVKAILLDPELFDEQQRRTGGLQDPTFGKLKEPLMRFVQWARAFNVKSRSGKWLIAGHPENARIHWLGQVPLNSPSVFNFFRPGYVPPNTDIAGDGSKPPLVAPEFQITDEATVMRYVKAMHLFVDLGVQNGSFYDAQADYSPWLPKASNPLGMVMELNTLLVAGQMLPTTIQRITKAITAMPFGTTAQRLSRVKAAVLLTLCSPEFIAHK